MQTEANYYTMSDGDMVDFMRAQAAVEAMQVAARRHPWRAKGLRMLAHQQTQIMRDVLRRYEVRL